MRAEYINPFILSTKAVFDTMVFCPLTRGKPYMKKGNQPEHEISGIIGYTGYAEGCVVISLDRQMALHATSVMIEKKISSIDQDVVDTVGELANMIAGAAKNIWSRSNSASLYRTLLRASLTVSNIQKASERCAFLSNAKGAKYWLSLHLLK